MRLFPYKEYTIQTSMTKADAVESLIYHTKKRGEFRFAAKHEYFLGDAAEGTFDMILRMYSINNNSRQYRPVIQGHIAEDEGITNVRFSASTSFMSKFIIFLVTALFIGSAVTQYGDTQLFFTLLGFAVFAMLTNIGAIHLYFRSYMKRCLQAMEMVFKKGDEQNYSVYEKSPSEYTAE